MDFNPNLVETYVYLNGQCYGNGMLFDRFVFVLYVLIMYIWFLAGVVSSTEYRYIPLLMMMASLLSVILVTLLQLQTLVRQNTIYSRGKWETVAWSSVHILLAGLFTMDTVEYTNVLVILGLAGILMTTVVFIVGTCACFVIIRDSREWQTHMHLTCICFWVLTQYMLLRTSGPNIHIVTSIPVACMFLLRIGEHFEYGCSARACIECILWLFAIVLHVVHEFQWLSSFIFFITCAIVVVTMALLTRHAAHLLLFAAMPLVLVSLLACAVYNRSWEGTQQQIMTIYDDMTAAPLERLPLDEQAENAWDDPL